MSKVAKACLLASGLFFLASGIVRLILNMWHDSLFVTLGLAVAFLAAAVIKDFRIIAEFLTMRTTKHGMNMGALILITLAILVSVNFIAVRNEKKWDWTVEGLNSLSDQSIKAAKAIDADMEIILLTNKGQQDEALRRQVSDLARLYSNENPKIRFTPYNARQRPDLANKFEFKSGPFGVFLETKGKQVRVEMSAAQGLTEEDLTKAMIKAARSVSKVVYFTQGHGERALDGNDAEGLAFLKRDLTSIYDVKPLNLLENPKIPADASAVVIAGPRQAFLESEMQTLRDYARVGGRLLIAADPGFQHNIAQLTKSFGVEFLNNYVLDPRAAIPGRGNIAALGVAYSASNSITKDFSGTTVFQLASAVSKAPDAPASLRFDEIIRTDGGAVSTNELSQQPKIAGRGPFTMAIAVEGKLPEPSATGSAAAPAGQDLAVVVFGDSDFMANEMVASGYLNRDAMMNSVAFLSKDTQLISIRPKQPAGNALEMNRGQILGFIFGFLLPLPILMFFSGGYIWWRRKTA